MPGSIWTIVNLCRAQLDHEGLMPGTIGHMADYSRHDFIFAVPEPLNSFLTANCTNFHCGEGHFGQTSICLVLGTHVFMI